MVRNDFSKLNIFEHQTFSNLNNFFKPKKGKQKKTNRKKETKKDKNASEKTRTKNSEKYLPGPAHLPPD